MKNIDLTHLSPQEFEKIMSVMRRDEMLQQKEEQRRS